MNNKKKYLFIVFIIFFFKEVYAVDLKNEINNKLYSNIDGFSENLAQGIAEKFKENERIKYLDISIDIQENLKPSFEIQSVNKITETSDGVIFNQSNIISHDGETTLNFGFGKRNLLNNETLMLGSNYFFDYHVTESHMRNGLGFEAISNVLDLRGNYYKAVRGFKGTDTGKEKALDGYDLQLDYHLSGKNNTDFYISTFEWENPSSTYKEKGEKIGIISQIGQLRLEAGYLDDNKDTDAFYGSVKLVVPLGGQEEKAETLNESLKSESVRSKLYIPVKRENRIKVVKVSGVSVSGF